jgi:hypothetical protein
VYRSGGQWSRLTWLKRLMLIAMACAFAMSIPVAAIAVGDDAESGLFSKLQAGRNNAEIFEVSPPEVIQELRSVLSSHQPQVKILSPRTDQVIEDDAINVKLQVEDLPIFQNADLGLGPHLRLFLDDRPGQAVYDLMAPVVVGDLKPGTHTLRALAIYPWLESFKNQGAYAEVTFHVFTKTHDNQPVTTQPLLTYNQPQGFFGAEPVLLDFYVRGLSNGDPDFDIDEKAISGQVRVTVNDSSFLMDGWRTLYLEGLHPGKNWVRLELLDADGDAIANTYNETVRLIDLHSGGQDSLAQIVRGDLTASQVRGIVDPDYRPAPAVEEVHEPISEPIADELPADLGRVKSDEPPVAEEPSTLNSQMQDEQDASSSSDTAQEGTMSTDVTPAESLESLTEQDIVPLESGTSLSPQSLDDFDAIAE